MTQSTIEWTDATWNPVTGCAKMSPGCEHCYAIADAWRLGHNPAPKVAAAYAGLVAPHDTGGLDWTGEARCLPERLRLPLHWKKPRRIFVNSMSDLFHHQIPAPYIQQVFDVMRRASWHQFQVLTKRAKRLEALHASLEWPPNVWMGVSVETARYTYRIDHLRGTGAAIKFVSLEPLLGPLPQLNLQGIDWVIVGGESGTGARPMRAEWVRQIHQQCTQARVSFFFKQWGGVNKKRTGRLLDGQTWDAMPSGTRRPRATPTPPDTPALFPHEERP